MSAHSNSFLPTDQRGGAAHCSEPAKVDPHLYPCFLGPYAENDNLLEKGLHLAIPEAERAGARLLVLRHTIMNPFMLDEQDGVNYIDRYFEFLSRRIDALLPAASRMTVGAARNHASS